jgi:hypothetical protein
MHDFRNYPACGSAHFVQAVPGKIAVEIRPRHFRRKLFKDRDHMPPGFKALPDPAPVLIQAEPALGSVLSATIFNVWK